MLFLQVVALLLLAWVLYDPAPFIHAVSVWCAHRVRCWINGLWLGFRTFWFELDLATLDVSLDAQLAFDQVLDEYSHSLPTVCLYLLKTLLFHYFDPTRFVLAYVSPALLSQVRVMNGFLKGEAPVQLRLLRTQLSRKRAYVFGRSRERVT